MESTRNITFEVTDEYEGKQIKDVLKNKLLLSSREISHAKAFADGILVNNNHQNVLYKLKSGDILSVTMHEKIEKSSEIVPIKGDLNIIYEDEDILILNKSPGVVVHPIKNYFDNSLSNYVAYHYKENNEEHIIRPIGRLDRETSGLIAFGKNRLSANILNKQGDDGSRVKEYMALCHGVFKESKGIVDAPIGETPGVKMVRMVRDDGDKSVTHYEVVSQKKNFALVRLRLETGRTHQIRVHMKHIGHELLGDSLYSKDILDLFDIKRCALHSSHMEIIHPITGEKMTFDANLPDDIKSELQKADKDNERI